MAAVNIDLSCMTLMLIILMYLISVIVNVMVTLEQAIKT
jgi:hypothetical protein